MKLLSQLLISSLLIGGLYAKESLSMSKADLAMYEEMLENNPADLFISEGEELFEELLGEDLLVEVLNINEDNLASYLAGFPRYIKQAGTVITLSQLTQLAFSKQKLSVPKLESEKIIFITAYIKSLANDESTNIDITANAQMKEAYQLGERIFHQRRGGRGLSCFSCHSHEIVGQRLRMQILPDLGSKKSATSSTWPAYRMTKSNMVSLDKRFQQCMKNALLAPLPLGSKEMVSLEVHITHLNKGHTIAIPGLKR
jgi:L-cysteine S-thiosulfotransferase